MTEKSAASNDVAMVGQGVYKANSGLQQAAFMIALPFLENAADKASQNANISNTDVFRIIEYGAAHGNNS